MPRLFLLKHVLHICIVFISCYIKTLITQKTIEVISCFCCVKFLIYKTTTKPDYIIITNYYIITNIF